MENTKTITTNKNAYHEYFVVESFEAGIELTGTEIKSIRQGGVNLKRIFGDQAFSIFIQAPSVEALRQRLIGRGTDTEEAIERRVSKAASEMEFAAGKFDHVLVNDDLQTAFAEAEQIIADFLQK